MRLIQTSVAVGLLALAPGRGRAQDAPPIPQALIAKVEPAAAAPGQRVTITGLAFHPGARVWLGGAEAADVSVQSGERLTLTVPDHDPGKVSVMIKNVDGTSVSRARTFEYVSR